MPLPSVVEKAVRRVYPPKNMWFYGHRLIGNPSTRDLLARGVASFLPSAAPGNSEAHQQASTLDRDGWVQLPNLLNQEQIGEITAAIQDKPCGDGFKAQLGTFTATNPPPGARLGAYNPQIILSLPYLMEVANDPRVLAVVSDLLGCAPTLSDLSLWWSFPSEGSAENAQLFHRDVDDLKFYKLFVHLTDVSPANGAHVYVKGSQRKNALTRIRRYEDGEIAGAFGKENFMTVQGEPGFSFIENTYGFHKGSVPRSARRLMFQAQYSVLPIALYDYKPVPAPRAYNCSLDPYVNRLFISR